MHTARDGTVVSRHTSNHTSWGVHTQKVTVSSRKGGEFRVTGTPPARLASQAARRRRGALLPQPLAMLEGQFLGRRSLVASPKTEPQPAVRHDGLVAGQAARPAVWSRVFLLGAAYRCPWPQELLSTQHPTPLHAPRPGVQQATSS